MQQATIAHVAEALNDHRAARLAAHPHLTLTGLYNVLEALRAGRALTDAERDTLETGQVATLQHLHDELDVAVAAAYGWPVNLPAAEVVARVVALNRERLAEEAAGQVRWLRPDYQAPQSCAAGPSNPAWRSMREPRSPPGPRRCRRNTSRCGPP